MKVTEIDKLIKDTFPLKLQEKWDESGMRNLVSPKEECTGVIICLDLTKEVVETAIKTEINFIISHHPIFLKNPDVKLDKYDANLLKLIKDNKINFASYHTNVDNSPEGLNMYIAKELDLHQIKVIPNTGIVTGRINFAYRPKVFASTLKNEFDLERILYTDKDLVKSVAICAGAGFSQFKENIDQLQNIDLLVTGDVKWHDWQFAKTHGLSIMDAGHDLENTFIPLITRIISNKYKLIKILTFVNKQNIKIVI